MEKYYKDIAVPASFSGISKISHDSKKSKKEVAQFLKENETYSLHKPIRKSFKRSSTTSVGFLPTGEFTSPKARMRSFAGGDY